MTTSIQHQARALGDPTRYALFRHLAEAHRPLGIADLTERFDFNHNAIRPHLAKLVDAGLVLEATASASGPGRPRLVYRVDPSIHERWGVTGPYERLSGLLAEALTTGRTPREVGRDAAGDLRADPPSGDGVADMAEAMARQGFAPEVRHRGRGTDIVLHHCPFESTARQAREAVCSLHLGIAEGLAAGSDVAVGELVAHDPRHAGCRLTVHADEDGAHEEATLTLRGKPAR